MTLDVWQHIRQEAKELAENEPMLASFFQTTKSGRCTKLFIGEQIS